MKKKIYFHLTRLGICDALLDIVSAGEVVLFKRKELSLFQIDLSTTFDCMNYAGLIFRLQNVGINGTVLDIITGFLTGSVENFSQ